MVRTTLCVPWMPRTTSRLRPESRFRPSARPPRPPPRRAPSRLPPPALRRARPRAPVLRPPLRRAPRRLPRQAPRLRTRRPRNRSLTRHPRSRLFCPTAPPGITLSPIGRRTARRRGSTTSTSLSRIWPTPAGTRAAPPSAWARVTSTPVFRFVTAACTTTSTPTPRLTSPAIRQAAT